MTKDSGPYHTKHSSCSCKVLYYALSGMGTLALKWIVERSFLLRRNSVLSYFSYFLQSWYTLDGRKSGKKRLTTL